MPRRHPFYFKIKNEFSTKYSKEILNEREFTLATQSLETNSSEDKKILSSHLNILITENGIEKAKLSFPAISVDSLVDLMPEKAHLEATKAGVDIEKISIIAKASDYKPQVLCDLKSGQKNYKIWLS